MAPLPVLHRDPELRGPALEASHTHKLQHGGAHVSLTAILSGVRALIWAARVRSPRGRAQTCTMLAGPPTSTGTSVPKQEKVALQLYFYGVATLISASHMKSSADKQ